MTEQLAAIGSAVWLGILTSISPCPLASNVAAISFVGRNVTRPAHVFVAGILYSLGRAATYVIIAMLVVSSVLSLPGVSFFLQQRMNQVLGPLLVVIGVGLLAWHRLPMPTADWGPALQRRAAGSGTAGATLLGIVFALSFCPVSAGLFFGALIPLAVSSQSRILLPAAYGIGTGLPVVAFALILALGFHWVGRAFGIVTRIERAARPVTGVVFIIAGIYLTVTHVLGRGI